MEFQFENRYYMTKPMMVESTWANMKGLGIGLGIATTILAMAAAGTLISGILAPPVNTGMLVRLAAGVIVLFFLWRLPGSTAKSILAELIRQNGGQNPECVALFGDLILSNMGDQEGYDYSRIRKVVSLKHSYVIYIDKRISIPVTRDGFTKGDFESFKAFLKEKRPDLKIPK